VAYSIDAIRASKPGVAVESMQRGSQSAAMLLMLCLAKPLGAAAT
jgi:hypothetical protein